MPGQWDAGNQLAATVEEACSPDSEPEPQAFAMACRQLESYLGLWSRTVVVINLRLINSLVNTFQKAGPIRPVDHKSYQTAFRSKELPHCLVFGELFEISEVTGNAQ